MFHGAAYLPDAGRKAHAHQGVFRHLGEEVFALVTRLVLVDIHGVRSQGDVHVPVR